MLDELEKDQPLSAENLFLNVRPRDRSFTNMPQISSYSKAMNSPWDKWLAFTDPAGIGDDEFEMEGRNCPDCGLYKKKALIETISNLAKTIDEKTVQQLLEKYKTAVENQNGIREKFKSAVISAFKKLTENEKYHKYKDLSYSKLLFFSDLQNIPALQPMVINGLPQFSKAGQDFINSFRYLDREMKIEMMSAMNNKEVLGQFVGDLNKIISPEKKLRDDNRAEIQKMAETLLSFERKKFSKSFRSEKGNICQKFQL